MKILDVTISGFQSFGDEPTTVSLDSPGITIISGHNGSGKSSIIDSIDWCLFGSTRGDLANSVVGKTGVAQVATRFTSAGEEFKVVRTRRDNKNRRKGDPPNVELKVWKSGSLVESGNVSSTQEYIEKATGMTSAEFHALVSIPQAEMILGTGFTAASPETRRDVLMSLVPGLDEWENVEKVVSEELSETKKAVRYAESHIESKRRDAEALMSRLREAEGTRDRFSMWNGVPVNQAIADARARMEENDEAIRQPGQIRAQLKEELSSLSHERLQRNRSTDARRAQLERASSTVQDCMNRITSGKEELSSLSDQWNSLGSAWKSASESLPGVIEQGRSVESELSGLEEALSQASAEVSRIMGLGTAKMEQLSSLESLDGVSVCPTCGSQVSREHVFQHASQIRGDISSLEEALGQARQRETAARTRKNELSTKRSELLESASSLKAQISDADRRGAAVKSQAQYVKNTIKSMQDTLAEVEGSLYPDGMGEHGNLWSAISSELNSLPSPEQESQREIEIRAEIDRIDSRSDLAERRLQIKAEIEELEAGLAEYNKAQGVVSEIEQQIGSIDSEIEALQESFDSLSEEHNDLIDAKAAVGPKGIPDMLLTATVKELEDKFNEILALTDHSTGGPMRVSIRQERELASKEGTKKVIDIVTYGGNSGERDVKMLSGGERVRVTMSALLAMVQVVNKRRSDKIETIIMDEPLGHLDSESVPVVMSLLHRAIEAKVVSSITLVSHNTNVIESAARNIVVAKDDTDGFSVVEEI